MGYFHFGGLGPVITWLIWPLMYLYTFFIKIPVYPNAPLQTPALHSSSHSDETLTPGDGETTPQWPLVLFSHGLCGTRTTYSNLCTRLAASGRIVLAFEHRDGSAPVCMPRNPETGEAKVKLYLKPDQVIWPKNGNTEDEAHTLALRFDQLEFRKREIYLAYSAFTSFIHTGNLGDLQVIDDTTGDVRAEQIGYESWKGLVECEKDVAFVGHSFGGATVFSLLSTPPPVPYNPIPITHALALDPWLEPLPSPGPEPYVHTESASDSLVGVEKNAQCDQVKDEEKGFPPPKMLVLNSEGFSLWRVHFSRLEEVVKGWDRGRVITILRSTHVSFSDFPLLIPSFFPSSSSSTATLLSKIIGNLSVAFLEDRLYRDSGHGDDEKSGEIVDGEGLGVRERELVIEDVEWREGVAGRKWKRRMVGEVGDVVLH
ncbi:hypothetical protein JAAARDRAFT_27943 [Jaapia argillacea MUCL 33604]|uniref:1-alkyl-2-acetylglycerophosphocholine esterase n=1 Tax=Jaapia argillacea MUCL 33604 TaxID=933084 RepID=A0A067QDS7_9AGAM|nr:hypothetical protein JAAARDRAFT_27943 [Jaapia argillacea MUCL 33604]